MIYPDFKSAIRSIEERMVSQSYEIHPDFWQSIDVSRRPEASMHELMNIYFQVLLKTENLEDYQYQIEPNLPWADRHFELERASGEPINPGETWKEWPYAWTADRFRHEGEKFSHTYAERYWPKHAEYFEKGSRYGIRYDYGDLNDLIKLLAREPMTRQAYLPVWFPEDTGVVHGERVPCTLGYHFIQRGGHLHVFYPIRSCDIVRHFRDDLYLTVRLVFWILNRVREINQDWQMIKPGFFTMWIGSLHCFVNDHRILCKKYNSSR